MNFSITKNVLYTLVDLIIFVLTKKKRSKVSLGYYTGKTWENIFFLENIFVNLVAPIFDIICMQDTAQFCQQAG